MLKKILSSAAFMMCLASSAFAQKYGYVDLSYMLDNIPDYKLAQNKIDTLSARWQKEIDARYKEIDQLYQSYQNEQVLLTEDMKKQRRQEIEDKEKAAKELQKKHFGYEGDLFKKREELIKPIQDRVFDAVQKFANNRGYDMIFDKSSGVTLFYASTKLDVSDNVLIQMGYTPRKQGATDSKETGKGTKPGSTPNKNPNDLTPPPGKTAPNNGMQEQQNAPPRPKL